MPELFLERYVPHLIDRMFDLVGDLESYPRFVPNCRDMQVERDEAAGGDVRIARMTVQFGPLTQTYTSRVEADRSARTITASAVDGPFAYLDSTWSFAAEGGGTRIRFDLAFKMSNPVIAAVAEPAFAGKQEEILDAFVEEADRRFGD